MTPEKGKQLAKGSPNETHTSSQVALLPKIESDPTNREDLSP